MADFTIFFAIVLKWDPLLRIFWPKWDPCLRIFAEKVTHLGGTSPYALTCEYPPGFMRPYLRPPWTNSCQIWCVRVFHHVLLKYCHENAEMQKRKFDDVTLQYSIELHMTSLWRHKVSAPSKIGMCWKYTWKLAKIDFSLKNRRNRIFAGFLADYVRKWWFLSRPT